MSELGLLRFEEGYFERIWGGNKLRTLFGKDIPKKPIGEAWMISDHPVHESVVAEGPLAGQTLRDLLKRDTKSILGQRPQLTPGGRFPLLLKILDASQVLSVQVHPNDECAARLGEPDVGKTEMWHVLQADPGSELICGLDTSVTPPLMAEAVAANALEPLMNAYGVERGSTFLLPAGVIHAIGAGIVLAEIQQNSDLTYRLYDWGRLDDQGKPRQLHVDKAMEAIHFGFKHDGPAKPLACTISGTQSLVLSACQYFAAELVAIDGTFERETQGQTFHILLAINGEMTVEANASSVTLNVGQALLVPGCAHSFTVTGHGDILDYYVPDLQHDIIEPLRKEGHSPQEITQLGAQTFSVI